MQHKNDELLNNIYSYLEEFMLDENRSPTMAEIGTRFAISRACANNYVHELKERGRITYDGKTAVTDKLGRLSPTVNVPCFMSAIPCGPLEQLDGSIDGYVSLPTSLFGASKDMFIVRACGDSMTGAGIDDGDLVVMSKKKDAKQGDIIAALDENGNNTLKRLNMKKGRYVLHPENSAYPDIEVNELSCQGVAEFIIKALK